MRFALLALVTLLSPILVTTQTGNPRSTGETSPRIEVKLIPEKSVTRPGETLSVMSQDISYTL